MSDHVKTIDAKVTDLSNALATLAKGTSLQELLRIIRFPGFTTPAEFAFMVAIVDSMKTQVAILAKMETDLLAAAKQVPVKTPAHA